MTVDESNLKFGTTLSASAQCALLKTYEDELYNRMKAYLPNKKLSRVTTAKFQSNVNHRRRGVSFALSRLSRTSLDSLPEHEHEHESDHEHESEKVDENAADNELESKPNDKKPNIKTLKDFRSIEDFNKRVEIANHLEKAMNLVGMLEQSDAMSINRVARKYERWQLKWQKILDECF